jgi:hypothetical protein
MQSYIYHFVGPTKRYLSRCRWQGTDPPELPFPWDQNAHALVAQFGSKPPSEWEAKTCLQADTIANLLAICPEMRIKIRYFNPEPPDQPYEIRTVDRQHQFAATRTSYLLLIRVGPNASRL